MLATGQTGYMSSGHANRFTKKALRLFSGPHRTIIWYVWAMTCELNDLWPRYVVCWFI